jgi:hypothetical protein
MFTNIGGIGFPFQRVDGAQLQRGVVGTHACIVYMEHIAFLGSGRDESPAVWLGSNGALAKLSTREIDQILLNYNEEELARVVMETHSESGLDHLYIRLPDQTLVYDGAASKVVGDPVWMIHTTSITGLGQHRASNRAWCYNRSIVGDPQSSAVGYQTDSVTTHWGQKIGWDFGTMIVYNEGRGLIFHELELVCLSGRTLLGTDPQIGTEYSLDGEVWSQMKYVKVGKQGERAKRIVWLQQGSMEHWRMQRFSGTSDAKLSFARLEARVEPLVF